MKILQNPSEIFVEPVGSAEHSLRNAGINDHKKSKIKKYITYPMLTYRHCYIIDHRKFISINGHR